MYPFDLHGPEFTTLYGVCTVAATIGAYIYRSIKRNIGTACDAHPLHVELDPYEIAYLRGGKQAVMDAVLATLVQSGVIVVEGDTVDVKPDEKPDEAPIVKEFRSKLLYGRNTSLNMKVALKRWKDEPVSQLKTLSAKLEAAGYIVKEGYANAVSSASALIALSPVLIGLPKVFMGINLGKPVTFLVMMLIVNVVFGIIYAASKISRTTQGDVAMNTLTQHNAALKVNASTNPNALSPLQVATVAALFGPAVFTLGMLGDFHRKIAPPPSYGGSCSGGSSCGGGSCGGGCGGGCGGCGG